MIEIYSRGDLVAQVMDVQAARAVLRLLGTTRLGGDLGLTTTVRWALGEWSTYR